MGVRSIPSPASITKEEFEKYLDRYDSCIEAVSQSKGSRHGERSLLDLDEYRYGEAVATFGSTPPKREMELEDVKTLVHWKLRHGKFRPTLMKLVSSNDPAAARDTIREALAAYDRTARVSNAVPILTRLRGIGPATASLLLAVHDPDRVVFFADEAFEWLCATPDTEGGGGGTKAPAIKYNLAECVLLNDRAKTLRDRLGVRAVDVERVAFALLRQPEPREGSDAKRDVPNGDDEQAKQQMIGGRLASKRKLEPEESGGSAKGSPLRRSKRNVR